MSWIEHISPELNMVGAGSCENEKTHPLSQTPDNLLLLVNHGDGILVCNNHNITLHEGDWVIIPPSSEYKITQTSDNFWAQWLNFNWIKTSLQYTIPEIPHAIQSGNNGEHIHCNLLWDIIWSRWNSNDICEIKTCNALLLEMLIRIFSYHDQTEMEALENDIPEDQLALLLKRLLDEMPPNQKSIQEVLAGMNFNYEHMMRIFTKNFGISPLEYLIKLRLEQSAKKTHQVEADSSGLVKIEYEGGYYAYEHDPKLRRHFDFSGYDRY